MTIEFSAEIGKISKALVGAQAAVGIAVKNQENSHFKSAYADLPAVLEVATPALAKHGLALIQAPGSGTDSLTLTTLLLHESGEWMLLPLAAIPLQAATAHGFGSALSYLRRYATQACLKISVGQSDDDDANIATAQAPAPVPKSTSAKQKSNHLDTALRELGEMLSRCETAGLMAPRHLELAKTVLAQGGPLDRVEAAIAYLRDHGAMRDT